MFRIAICEDKQSERDIILSLLSEYQAGHSGIEICTQSFSSGEQLLRNIRAGQKYDLFLLDIIMPGITGIDLAKELRARDEDGSIIFLTNSVDYALSAYKVSATQYMLKPIDKDELFTVLDKTIAIFQLEKEKYLAFMTSERIVKIPFSSIIYIEITGHIMKAHLENGCLLLSKSIRIPFPKAVAALLEDRRFLYAHTSFVLNMEHVQELSGKTFVMTGGDIIPIPKYKLTYARKYYLDFLMQNGL